MIYNMMPGASDVKSILHFKMSCSTYVIYTQGCQANRAKLWGGPLPAAEKTTTVVSAAWCYHYLFLCHHYYNSTTLSSSVNFTSPLSGNLLLHLSKNLQLLLMVIFHCLQQKWEIIFLCLWQGSLMDTGQWQNCNKCTVWRVHCDFCTKIVWLCTQLAVGTVRLSCSVCKLVKDICTKRVWLAEVN